MAQEAPKKSFFDGVPQDELDSTAGWTFPRELSIRDAWEAAVSRVADHFVERKLRDAEKAPVSAREFLEDVVDNMQKFNPESAELQKKSYAVDFVAGEYLDSQDIEWTMALHSLLGSAVGHGKVNTLPPKTPKM